MVYDLYLCDMDSCGEFIGQLVLGDTSNSARQKGTHFSPDFKQTIVTTYGP